MFIVLLLDKQLLDGQVSMSALSGDGDDDGLVSSAVDATEKECKERGFIVLHMCQITSNSASKETIRSCINAWRKTWLDDQKVGLSACRRHVIILRSNIIAGSCATSQLQFSFNSA